MIKMKAKITMTKANNLTIQEAYDLFARKQIKIIAFQ